jgi:hypothetical protein
MTLPHENLSFDESSPSSSLTRKPFEEDDEYHYRVLAVTALGSAKLPRQLPPLKFADRPQFSLKGLMISISAVSVFFALLHALDTPAPHILAALLASALTATLTMVNVQWWRSRRR